MINVNEVFLSGNVVADAELRYTKTGKPVLTFRMATNKYVNEQQSTQYHNIVCWVDAEKYSGLKKGDFWSLMKMTVSCLRFLMKMIWNWKMEILYEIFP